MDGTVATTYVWAVGDEADRRELLELVFEKLVVGEGRIVRPVLREPFRLLEGRRGPVPEAFQRESAVAEEVVGGEA
jgi:hypothetical protein